MIINVILRQYNFMDFTMKIEVLLNDDTSYPTQGDNKKIFITKILIKFVHLYNILFAQNVVFHATSTISISHAHRWLQRRAFKDMSNVLALNSIKASLNSKDEVGYQTTSYNLKNVFFLN